MWHQVLGFAVPFPSHSTLRKSARPNPFSWTKLACFDFFSSKVCCTSTTSGIALSSKAYWHLIYVRENLFQIHVIAPFLVLFSILFGIPIIVCISTHCVSLLLVEFRGNLMCGDDQVSRVFFVWLQYVQSQYAEWTQSFDPYLEKRLQTTLLMDIGDDVIHLRSEPNILALFQEVSCYTAFKFTYDISFASFT